MTTATRDHRPTALVFPHPLRRHGGRLLGSLSLALTLAACNTIKGIGQDVQSAGGAIERAAR